MRRIAILGKNTLAVEILRILQTIDGCKICLVSPNNDDAGEDGWQLSLKKYATLNHLNVVQFKKIRSQASLDYLKDLKLDFIFSLQYDQILDEAVISTAKFGAINLHFAPLPKYRGVAPVAWALINGEKEFGVTLHYMDPGVDTGDIIAQKKFPISDIKNARELYERCVREGIELFRQNVKPILNLINQSYPQNNAEALYYPKGALDFGKNKVDFRKDTRSLVNWIKAFIFPPFQYPYFEYKNEKFSIVGVAPDYRKNCFEKPGEVVFRHQNFFKIATHDSYVNLIVKDKDE